MRLAGAAAVVIAQTAIAGADSELLLQERWQDVPIGQRLQLSQQITDQLTELGNFIGTQVNVLSDDMLALKFDGRRRRARVRLGTSEGYLRFRFDSDWHFAQGRARIRATLDLGIGTHDWHVELPDLEMAPASAYGERGLEVRLPLFERRW